MQTTWPLMRMVLAVLVVLAVVAVAARLSPLACSSASESSNASMDVHVVRAFSVPLCGGVSRGVRVPDRAFVDAARATFAHTAKTSFTDGPVTRMYLVAGQNALTCAGVDGGSGEATLSLDVVPDRMPMQTSSNPSAFFFNGPAGGDAQPTHVWLYAT